MGRPPKASTNLSNADVRWTPQRVLRGRAPRIRVVLFEEHLPATIDRRHSTENVVMVRYAIPFGTHPHNACRLVPMRKILDALNTRRSVRV